MPLPRTVPTTIFPISQMYHGSRLAPKGVTRVHHLYLPRAGQALGIIWAKAQAVEDPRLRNMILFFVEQAIWGLSLLNRYQPIQQGRPGGSQVNRQLTGVYYIASQHAEVSPWYNLGNKLDRLIKAFRSSYPPGGQPIVGTGTAARLDLPADSVDYIFTDPPFGENIFYADLNFLVESWHQIWTDATPEAIVDPMKHKGLAEYQHLMLRCFAEYYRVLKPGHWMTLVFHNSRNSVWNAIQEAMTMAGFIVADVRTLDKQQVSYRQGTSTAVKQDLVISAYRPNGGLEARFKLEAGSAAGVWDFVRTHLRQVPVFVRTKAGPVEVIAERVPFVLFDRMVAFHVQRGVLVPMSAPDFYVGLERYFVPRDGMYFLPDQVAEYDRRFSTVREIQQLELFVADEASAIKWVRQQLLNKPHTLADLTPPFMQEQRAWQKHEQPIELTALLEQNFLRYEGRGPIPAQIVAWLKKGTDLRALLTAEGQEQPDGSLTTESARLLAAARDRWYVPDPNRAKDLENLRTKALLREWAAYQAGKGRLKQFRMEAVRAGFQHAWNERDYATIVQMAARLPENIVLDDPHLLMYCDAARMHVPA